MIQYTQRKQIFSPYYLLLNLLIMYDEDKKVNVLALAINNLTVCLSL